MAHAQSIVWLAPSATSFSCLCETCLESSRQVGALFSDALAGASVRGNLGLETDVAIARCRAGHEVVVRRSTRPAGMQHRNDGQLQIA
jgi:hypothetical protein